MAGTFSFSQMLFKVAEHGKSGYWTRQEVGGAARMPYLKDVLS